MSLRTLYYSDSYTSTMSRFIQIYIQILWFSVHGSFKNYILFNLSSSILGIETKSLFQKVNPLPPPTTASTQRPQSASTTTWTSSQSASSPRSASNWRTPRRRETCSESAAPRRRTSAGTNPPPPGRPRPPEAPKTPRKSTGARGPPPVSRSGASWAKCGPGIASRSRARTCTSCKEGGIRF